MNVRPIARVLMSSNGTTTHPKPSLCLHHHHRRCLSRRWRAGFGGSLYIQSQLYCHYCQLFNIWCWCIHFIHLHHKNIAPSLLICPLQRLNMPPPTIESANIIRGPCYHRRRGGIIISLRRIINMEIMPLLMSFVSYGEWIDVFVCLLLHLIF